MDGAGLTGYALTVDPVPDRKSLDVGNIETPPGWHGLRSSYIPYYNRRLCWPVQRPAWCLVSGMRWMCCGGCDTLQRGTDGIIAACVGLVSYVVGLVKLQETPL